MKGRQLTKAWLLTATILLALSSATAGLAADDGAAVAVTVRNSRGALSGAAVRLIAADGTIRRESSDAHGVARFSGLGAGTYTVTAELEGFADFEETGVAVAAGEQVTIDAFLVLAEFSSAITVRTPNRRQQLLLDVAEPTTLIDALDILDAGAQTAADVLSEQAGDGVVVQSGGGQGYVSINGIGNQGILLEIDGRRYLGRDGFGNFNLEDLDLAGIERIEVVKGVASALYGTDALGGIINLITRKAGTAGMHHRSELVFGSHHDLRITETLGRGSRRAGWNLIPSWRTFDGFDLDPDNPQTIGQPASELLNFLFNGRFRFSDHLLGRWFSFYSRREEEKNFFAAIGESYDQQRELVRTILSPEFDFTLTADTHLNLRLTLGKYDRDEIHVYEDRQEVLDPWREWNMEAHLTGRQRWRALGREHVLQVGYEYRHQEMDRIYLQMPGSESPRVRRDLHVGWFQQELVFSKLTLGAGLRHDYDSVYGDETSPKLSAVYAPTRSTRLRASWGQGFRAPRFEELFIRIPPFFEGNPDLRPETSETLTAGFSYSGSRLRAAVDYFHTELDAAIVFALLRFEPPFFYTYSYKNVDGVAVREGFNTAWTLDLPGGFVPSLAYTYLTAKDRDAEELAGHATHSVFLKLVWSHSRLDLRANLTGVYHGKETPSSFDGTHTPAYELWNVQVSKSFGSEQKRRFRVWVRIDNLFDETGIYRRGPDGQPLVNEVLQVWEDGRNYHGGVTVELDWPR